MANAYTPDYVRLNALESAEDQVGYKVLQAAFGRLSTLLQPGQLDHENQPGSSLADDDRFTAYNPVSYQVAYFSLVAIDHLRFLRNSITSRAEFAVMAEYTVVRSALEACANGIWLLSGGTKAKRVKNSLRLSWDSADDAVSLLRATGAEDLFGEDIRTRLQEIKESGPARQASIENMPAVTEVLKEADRHVKTGTISGLEAWKICSGIAHSNPQVALALLEHSRVPDGVSHSRLSNRVGLLAALTEIAVTYLEVLNAKWASAASASPTGARRRTPR